MRLSTYIIGSMIFAIYFTQFTFASSDCSIISNCIDCTSSSRFCSWEVSTNNRVSRCSRKLPLSSSSSSAAAVNASFEVYDYDDTCPQTYSSSDFLSHWIGDLLPVIKDLTLLDLSFPGTHDTLTHDLSTIVSEGGMDDALVLAELMHNYSTIVPGIYILYSLFFT